MLTKSRSARTKKVSPRIWRSVKTVEVFTSRVAHAFSCHSWWEPSSKIEQTQQQKWKGRKIQVFQSSFDFTSWKILTCHLNRSCPDGSSPVQHFTEFPMGLGQVQLESWPWWSQQEFYPCPTPGFPLWPWESPSSLCTSVSSGNTMLSCLTEVPWGQFPGAWGPWAVTLITGTGKSVWVTGYIPFLWHLNPKEHLNKTSLVKLNL